MLRQCYPYKSYGQYRQLKSKLIKVVAVIQRLLNGLGEKWDGTISNAKRKTEFASLVNKNAQRRTKYIWLP